VSPEPGYKYPLLSHQLFLFLSHTNHHPIWSFRQQSYLRKQSRSHQDDSACSSNTYTTTVSRITVSHCSYLIQYRRHQRLVSAPSDSCCLQPINKHTPASSSSPLHRHSSSRHLSLVPDFEPVQCVVIDIVQCALAFNFCCWDIR